ncbi:DUF1415 domain-containing protein [Corallincola spongiicola]|uniref:DUF1415 domain-containing protein n=1 Tax=Corallincola spongiicola TaxID=2520508 RepID=A0ABY1WSI0_9GAMM|nr:DUF1415 domain-containing protein [Corallincola spongiicola]TAA47523.1 DUF1415 domain-containing protein [Corallincola spongiicola]
MTDTVAAHPQTGVITKAVEHWLQQVVIGLNLCPFAAAPSRRGAVRIQVTTATSHAGLSDAMLDEMILLDESPVEQLETSLLVIPEMLQRFDEYNQYLDIAEGLLEQYDRDGIYQIASFHPDYCFAGAAPDDAENLTNRAPYPILHLIREEQMERVLRHYPNPEQIPERNIRCVSDLTEQQKRELFAYLY